MLQTQRNKYMENSVSTASPAQLLIMLCDGAIRFCRQGIEGIMEKNYASANTALCKVQDIIRELSMTLNRSIPIADSLQKLYDYFIERLIQANIKKDAEPANEVLGYLVELKETWVQAVKTGAAANVKLG